MKKELIENLRQDYKNSTLTEEEAPKDPFILFEKWFSEALQSGIYEPNAMTLSTAALSGKPSSRIVLLKGFDGEKLTFYTNYQSQKGKDLEANPQVSLLFFWPELERQIRIGGLASKNSGEEARQYFQSRPRGSQLGALASPQSQIIPNREFLDQKWKELDHQYQDKEIPKPENWGGYHVHPYEFEFWQGRTSRLHDRICYNFQESIWTKFRKAP